MCNKLTKTVDSFTKSILPKSCNSNFVFWYDIKEINEMDITYRKYTAISDVLNLDRYVTEKEFQPLKCPNLKIKAL